MNPNELSKNLKMYNDSTSAWRELLSEITSLKFVYLHNIWSIANFLLDGFAVLAWHLLCLLRQNIVANLVRLIFADFMGHPVAFLMGLPFAFLLSVTDCHVLIVVLAGLLSITVPGALQLSLFHQSAGRNLVAFRCILGATFLLVLSVAFLPILSVAFHIAHFSLNILLWKGSGWGSETVLECTYVDGCALLRLSLIPALGLIRTPGLMIRALGVMLLGGK